MLASKFADWSQLAIAAGFALEIGINWFILNMIVVYCSMEK